MRCESCGREVKINCDWYQGRCPYRKPIIDTTKICNLIAAIKNWFKFR